MKKLVLVIIIGSMVCLSGCGEGQLNNEKAKLYNDNEAIVESYDSFNYLFRNSEGKNSEFKMNFKTFSGTDTIMEINSDGKEELTLTYNTKVNRGKLKLVFINPNNEFEIIIEGEGNGDYTTTLESGKYRVKAVGKDAKGSLKIKADTDANVRVNGEEWVFGISGVIYPLIIE